MIIAETGADMTRFATPANWRPGPASAPAPTNPPAGSSPPRPAPATNTSKAPSASRRCPRPGRKNTYLAAKYRRIAARRGPMKAIVAVEHAILTAVWHMLTDGEFYADPGADYYTRLDPIKAKNNAIKKLNSLGFNVTITPATAA